MNRVAISILSLAVVAGCSPDNPQLAALPEEGRLDPRVAPTAQFVSLDLDARQESFAGSVRIELAVSSATNSFRFHAQDMTLDRIELSGEEGPIDVEIETGEDGMLLATTGTELSPGAYELEIDFSSRFNTRAVGLYRVEHGGDGYLFTQFEAVDARKAFPCWDEPLYKIPFQLTLRVPTEHEIVTNTPAASVTVEDGFRTVQFQQTKPLPTYLLAIAAGPLESVPIPGMSIPGRVVTVRGQSALAGAAVATTPPILAALERYFGSPYPYEKLDLIAVPEYWPGAMENPGAITFDDSLLLVDPEAASASQMRTLAAVTAHELAHIWFGDLVTMKWWDDLWLNESFASWLGSKIADETYPEYGIALSSMRRTRRVYDSDARPSTKPIRKPVRVRADIMDGLGLAYGKGQAVLGMVEEWIGEEAFRQGVLDYLDAHAWGNAEASDLWSALSEASDADVAGVLRSFLEQPGYPLVSLEIEPGGVVSLWQERFLNDGVEAEEQSWLLPVRLAFGRDGQTETRVVLLGEGRQTIGLESEVDWALPNAGAQGYYRWKIPTEDLLKLARSATDILEPRERAAFLGNATALLDAGEIGGDTYLQILNAFAGDPEPEVVSNLITSLDKVHRSFVPDELSSDFARYVRSTLRPALDRFGLERRDGESEAVSLFRPRLFRWLGDQGQDAEVRSYAAELTNAYMKDPQSIDPSLASAALSVAAIGGDRKLFEAYTRGFEDATVPVERERYLSAVGSFSDPELQDAALEYALGGNVRSTELFTIPMSLPETETAGDRVYSWLTDHFSTIRETIPPDFLPMLPYVAGGCSVDRLAAAHEFFTAPENTFEGAERSLAKVSDQVNDCANLRRREGAVVAAYLCGLDGSL